MEINTLASQPSYFSMPGDTTSPFLVTPEVVSNANYKKGLVFTFQLLPEEREIFSSGTALIISKPTVFTHTNIVVTDSASGQNISIEEEQSRKSQRSFENYIHQILMWAEAYKQEAIER